ncbi:MAG: glycosyltransferase family 2 protein [Armatimonadota bacterium]
MTDLSIIIVNWNTREELARCLASVYADDPGGLEVTVIDNASTDGSAEMVREEFPAAHLIANTRNLGFAKASNQGIRMASGRYVMLLNPDSEVRPGALSALLRFADGAPDAGIIGIKVLNPDGSLQFSCRHFPTLAAGIFRNTIIGHFFPKNTYTRDYLLADWDHKEIRVVDWVSGAALTMRREFIDDVGLLDERFFMYCEDVDLGYRAKQKGWLVVYFPHAAVVHARAKGSDQNPNRMIYEFHRSMYRFFRKHYWKDASIPVRLIVPLGLIARASFFIGRNYYYKLRGVRRGKE